MLIPSKTLNILTEIREVSAILKSLIKKKHASHYEMVPLEQNKSASNELPNHITIFINNSEDETPTKTKKQRKQSKICILTCLLFIFCFNFYYFDIFARMKRILSLMDTPKIIDYFNYPIFICLVFYLIESNNSKLYIDKCKIIKQGSNFYLKLII